MQFNRGFQKRAFVSLENVAVCNRSELKRRSMESVPTVVEIAYALMERLGGQKADNGRRSQVSSLMEAILQLKVATCNYRYSAVTGLRKD